MLHQLRPAAGASFIKVGKRVDPRAQLAVLDHQAVLHAAGSCPAGVADLPGPDVLLDVSNIHHRVANVAHQCGLVTVSLALLPPATGSRCRFGFPWLAGCLGSKRGGVMRSARYI